MQLKRLEAYGFKSFAERIAVQFDHGITAVVGPNGSGKSNITDAVRWVLGEQNIRMLRGLRSEDIIFAGSAARRALSVAEVVLVFDNTDKKLPIDYDEVVVKRRLYRNGDSEIYLNDSRCRIKDIYQLFADTGIGHDGMSIIGQNRLNDILDSRPEERRVFFEETAGITKYRTRKQDALRKLREHEGDLVRLNDIMYAHATELEPLAVQSQKTMRFRILDEERRTYHLTSLVQKYSRLSAEHSVQERLLDGYRADEVCFLRERVDTEKQKTKIEERIAAIDLRLDEQSQKYRVLQDALDSLRQEAALIEGRQEQRARYKADKEQMRTSAAVKIETTEQEVVQIDRLLSDKSAAYQGKIAEQEALRTDAEQLRVRLSQKRSEIERKEHAQRGVQRVLSRLRELYAVAVNSYQQGDEDCRQEMEAMAQKKERLAKLQLELSEKRKEVDTAEQQMYEERAQKECLAAAIRDMRAKLQMGEAQLRHIDIELQRVKQNLGFAMRMQESYEGFGKDVQAVLQAKEPWRHGVAGTVADLISIPDRCLTAIEVALGGSVRNIVTEDTDTAKAAISYLKRNNGGRATFLPLTTITVRTPRIVDLRRYKGVVGWAHTLVQTEEHFQRVAEHLLGQTLVMEHLDDALVAAKQEGYRLRIVTLTGELLNPGGAMSGGGRRKQSLLLNRRREIEDLETRLRGHQEQREQLSATINGYITKIKDMDERDVACTDRIEEASRLVMKIRGICEVLHQRVQDQTDAIRTMEQAEEVRLARGRQLGAKRDAIECHIAVCMAHEQRFSAQLAELRAHCTELDAELRIQEEKFHAAQIAAAALHAEIDTGKSHRQSRELELREAVRTRENVAQQLAQMAEELQKDAARLSLLSRDIGEREYHIEEVQKDGNNLKDQRLAYEAENRALDDALKKCRMQIEEVRNKCHECEKALERIGLRVEDCRDSLLSDYGLTPDAASEKVLLMDEIHLAKRLEEIDEEIRVLGAVNPNAVEEYAEKKARYEEETKQIEDLRAAKRDIERILEKIDQDMTRTFRDAFHQIQEYFNDIFVRLFGGGVAELRLTDKEDILSSGVEILVTLPDKKRQNLSALSGGERALTVIALLFSFLRYRPSPFSILDEIDAPLDEANVSRFGEFLKEFSRHTQFIVVTHRKGTMRAADTMYGVTVEDAGVSKVLSIRMKDYEAEQSA